MRLKVPTKIGPCYPRCTPTYGTGGRGSRSHRLVSGLIPGEAGPVLNGLLNNLIAYWPGDEVNGNLIDAHTNGLDLTDNGTVTSNPGHVYPLARQYTAANSEYHARPGDDALLSLGDIDCTFATWVYLNSKVQQVFIGKFGNVGNREYYIFYDNPSDRFAFGTSWDGSNYSILSANTFGSPSINTWYLFVVWHDSVADVRGIQIDNGIADTGAYATGIFDGLTRFAIGSLRGAGALAVANGRIGPSAMWKSAAGAGGVLTAAQRTALYNGGAGLTYAELTA